MKFKTIVCLSESGRRNNLVEVNSRRGWLLWKNYNYWHDWENNWWSDVYYQRSEPFYYEDLQFGKGTYLLKMKINQGIIHLQRISVRWFYLKEKGSERNFRPFFFFFFCVEINVSSHWKGIKQKPLRRVLSNTTSILTDFKRWNKISGWVVPSFLCFNKSKTYTD